MNDINTVFFSSDKGGSKNNKKSFRMVLNGKKAIYFSPLIYLPFGIESYAGKFILNLEINPEQSNEMYNFYSSLYQIDNILQNLSLTTPTEQTCETDQIQNDSDNRNQIKALVKGKQFTSCIRNGKNGFLIRTYVKQGISIHSKDNKEFYKMSELKGRNVWVELELGNLWIMPDSYGYILNVADITVP